jgi:quercetin dioxygenase-like cupin family protein
MFVKAGTNPPIHAHPHAQIDYMINGAADVSIDGVVTHVKPGTSIFIPGGVEHGFLVSEEDQEFLEFFTPGREDIE